MRFPIQNPAYPARAALSLLAWGMISTVGTAASGPSAPPAPAAGGGSPPNILVVIMDDVGADQLRCFDSDHGITGLDPGENLYTGNYPYPPTPNITRVAAEGVRFTRAFASPVCSPSRAQFQTGRYPFRNGIGGIVTPGARALQPPNIRQIPDLPLDEYILPEMLDLFAPTYESGYFGKWHLSADKCVVPPPFASMTEGDDHPYVSGWPEFRGLIRNVLGRPTPTTEGCIAGRAGYYDHFFVHVELPFPAPYVPCIGAPPGQCVPLAPFSGMFTEREWVEEFLITHEREDVQDFALATGEPWCAVWAAQAAHGPFDWPPEDLHSYGSEPEDLLDFQYWLRYSAIIEAFDTEFGRLRDALDEGPGETIWDRTMVIVIGDNGSDANAMRDAGMRYTGLLDGYVAPSGVLTDPKRFKGGVFHSGTNIPMVISGPGIVGEGSTSTDLVSVVDLFSTIRDYAGAPAGWTSMMGLDGRTIDGLTLRPALEGTGPVGHDEILSMHYSSNGSYSFAAPPAFQEVGFVYTDTTGDIYHLVRQQGAADLFYHLWDSTGAQVDVAEKFPLTPLSSYPYAAAVAAYDALLASP